MKATMMVCAVLVCCGCQGMQLVNTTTNTILVTLSYPAGTVREEKTFELGPRLTWQMGPGVQYDGMEDSVGGGAVTVMFGSTGGTDDVTEFYTVSPQKAVMAGFGVGLPLALVMVFVWVCIRGLNPSLERFS